VDYLSRVAEVKDTVHKQTLIFHVANIVLDQFPDATDLYSEIGSVTRCAKVDRFYCRFYADVVTTVLIWWSYLITNASCVVRGCTTVEYTHFISWPDGIRYA